MPSVLIIFREHSSTDPYYSESTSPLMGNLREGAKAEKRDPSGDILPRRHRNLLYKLRVSSAARLKTSSSMYQSPVNCWVNFPLTLVLWFITLLRIWLCQSKRCCHRPNERATVLAIATNLLIQKESHFFQNQDQLQIPCIKCCFSILDLGMRHPKKLCQQARERHRAAQTANWISISIKGCVPSSVPCYDKPAFCFES